MSSAYTLVVIAVMSLQSSALGFEQFMSPMYNNDQQDPSNRGSSPQGRPVAQKLRSQPVITTSNGQVRGMTVPVDNAILSPVVQFLGIPYAKPPIGKRRWKKPEATPKWKNVLNATSFGPSCPQSNGGPLPTVLLPLWFRPSRAFRAARQRSMSEDCLFLNIYVPADHYTIEVQPKPEKLAVMIFFHGHTYSEGSGSLYDGSVLASYGNVIVVTFNYRLGVLGFLSTLDSAAYGNFGLWDQLEMLRWVSANIEKFGGDKQRITVFGSGAGAASIGMLMLSPQTEGNRKGNVSEGFFKRAILQSGTALAPWAIVKKPRKHLTLLSRLLNCNNSTKSAMVACLRTKTWNELVSVNVKPEPYNLAFGPVVDGPSRLLSEAPATLMKRHELLNYDVMIGVSEGEGFGYVQERLNVEPDRYTTAGRSSIAGRNTQTIYQPKDFHIDVKKYVDAFYDQSKVPLNVVEDVVQFMYTNWIDQRDPDLLKRSLMDLYTDRQWVEPAVQVAEIQSDLKHAAYFYTFCHQPGSGIDRTWVKAGHGEELPFVFGAPLLANGYPLFPYNFTKNDKIIATAVMRYWTNFAQNGDPMVGKKQKAQFLVGIGKNYFQNIKWPRYYKSDRRHLRISTSPALESHYRAQKVAFWRSFLPRLTGSSCGPDVECDNFPLYEEPVDFSPFNNSIQPLQPVTSTWTPNEKSMRSINGATPKNPSASDGTGLSLQLSITLAVGFVLLFVNIIAFAVVSYHKERDKFRIEKLQSELKAYRQQGTDFKISRPLASAHTTMESCVESEIEAAASGDTQTFMKTNGVNILRPKVKIASNGEHLEQLVPLTNPKGGHNSLTSPPKGKEHLDTPSQGSGMRFKSISPRKGGDGAMTEVSSVGSISDVAFISNCADCNGVAPAYWNRGDGSCDKEDPRPLASIGERQTLPFPSRQSSHQTVRYMPQIGETSKARYNDPVRCHSALGACYNRGETDPCREQVCESSESEFNPEGFPRSHSSRGQQQLMPSARSRIASSALNLAQTSLEPSVWPSTVPRPKFFDGKADTLPPPLYREVAAMSAPVTATGIRSVTTKL